MQIRMYSGIIAAIILCLIGYGCSGNNAATVVPEPLYEIPQSQVENKTNRILLGMWEIGFDALENAISITPVRYGSAHYNITDMLVPPACDNCLEIAVNSYDPVTHILDADVALRNPTGVPVYDTRGILYTTDDGHLLINDDAWTSLFDILGGDTINPFRAFAKDEAQRAFFPGAEHTENYLIQFPDPPHFEMITFAVDASWPGNCLEPYAIENFSQGILYDNFGAAAELTVDVLDWHNNVCKVAIDEFPIATCQGSFSHLEGNTWTRVIHNYMSAPPGDYRLKIRVFSSDSGGLSLYKYVNVHITENPNKLNLTSPNGGEEWISGSSKDITWTWTGDISQVKIEYSKGSFHDDANLITDATENDGSFTWSSVPEIPSDTLKVRVSGAYMPDIYDVSDECFTILSLFPYDPVEVTTPWLNYNVLDVNVWENLACIAGDSEGMHIFDVSDPANPVWINRVELPGQALEILTSDGYAYVSGKSHGNPLLSGSHKLNIIDIDPPGSAHIVKSFSFSGGGQYHCWAAAGEGWACVARTFMDCYGSNHRLDIYDVQNPESAEKVGTLEMLAPIKFGVIKDGYAYITEAWKGLCIVDIEPLESAHVVKRLDISGYASPVTVVGNYAYVAGNDFCIINVKEPTAASVINMIDIPNDVQDITVCDGYAYITVRVSSEHQVLIYDVDPPASAHIVNKVLTPGDESKVSHYGNHILVAGGHKGFHVIDAVNPESAFIEDSVNPLDSCVSVAVDEGYAYVADTYDGFVIVDIDPLESASIINTIVTPGEAVSVEVSNGYAFLTDSEDALYIIDIEQPQSAYILNTVALAGRGNEIEVTEQLAYVTIDSGYFQIIDIKSIESASVVKTVSTYGEPWGVAVKGNYAFVADGYEGVQIIDIEQPYYAYIVKTVDMPGWSRANGIVTDGHYAYVATDQWDVGLVIIDITNPESAETIYSLDLFCAKGVVLLNGYALVSSIVDGLLIVDINPPEFPGLTHTVELSGFPRRSAVDSNYAYIASGYDGNSCNDGSVGGLRIVKF